MKPGAVQSVPDSPADSGSLASFAAMAPSTEMRSIQPQKLRRGKPGAWIVPVSGSEPTRRSICTCMLSTSDAIARHTRPPPPAWHQKPPAGFLLGDTPGAGDPERRLRAPVDLGEWEVWARSQLSRP
jgi:hypothetical protein